VPFPQLPGYQVEQFLGKGSVGTVYRARRLVSGETVALKVWPAILAGDTRNHARCRWEAALASRLSNGHILPLQEIGSCQTHLFCALPYIRGSSLAAIIRQRRRLLQGKILEVFHPMAALPGPEYLHSVLELIDQVLDAVARVHAAKGRYRELKPSNCLVDHHGGVWMTDFGLGRLVRHRGAVVLHDFSTAGLEWYRIPAESDVRIHEPAFLSPEEWTACRDTDQRADVYRLGVLLYQCLTTVLPYGTAPVQVGRSLPRPPGELESDIPSALDGLVLQALAPERKSRFASAVELRDAWVQARRASRTGSAPWGTIRNLARTVWGTPGG
jgi:serine/threonine-protein kinase